MAAQPANNNRVALVRPNTVSKSLVLATLLSPGSIHRCSLFT